MTQNNLGNGLMTLGVRTGGRAGLALLGRAVAAYEAALSVTSEVATPAIWATRQENIAITRFAMAGICEEPLPELYRAETAALSALRVYTPEHMPYYHEKASELLVDIRAAIAALP